MTIEMIVSGVTMIMEVFVLGLYHRQRDNHIGWIFRILLQQPFRCVKDQRKSKQSKDSFCECPSSLDTKTESFNDWHVIALRIDKIFGAIVAIVNILSFFAFITGVYMPAKETDEIRRFN